MSASPSDRKAFRRAVACFVVAAALTGCGPGAETVTLQADDVPSGADRSNERKTPRLTECKPINDIEQRFVDAATDKDEESWDGDYAQFRLKGGTVVDSQVLPAGKGDEGVPVELLIELQAAINTCADQVSSAEPLTPMTGLAKNEVGYRSETAGTVAEGIWTVRGDLAIGVGVYHDGKPAASAQKLLPAAIERARKAPQ